MASKAPRVGDVVQIPVEMNAMGTVVECVGIHLFVELFTPTLNTPRGTSYVRRDTVKVISRANSR